MFDIDILIAIIMNTISLLPVREFLKKNIELCSRSGGHSSHARTSETLRTMDVNSNKK